MRPSVRVLIFGILLVVGVAGYLATRPDTPATTPSSSPATMTVTGDQTSAYVDYRAGIIEATGGTKLLFFHAPWCPQCRALEASIKAGTIPAGVTIIKVDYDTNQALRKTYGVTLQTTIVRVNDQGELVKKFVAYDEPTLSAVLDNLTKLPL